MVGGNATGVHTGSRITPSSGCPTELHCPSTASSPISAATAASTRSIPGSDAGVDHRCEIYDEALHAWMMADFPVCNQAAAERH